MATFPGEKYLLEELPAYGGERQMLLLKFLLTFAFWTMLVPYFLASENSVAQGKGNGSDSKSDKSPNDTVTSTTTTTTKSSSRTTKKTTTTTIVKVQRKTTKKSGASKKNETKKIQSEGSPSTAPAGSKNTQRVVDGTANLLCCVGFLLHAVYILVTSSPDNYYTSRAVFETPLFSADECDHLVGMAERVARENHDMAQKFVETNPGEIEKESNATNTRMSGYLKEPFGWQKKRHKAHPTTDLNLVTDNFSEEDRSWIQQRLDARLAPTLERIYGVPPSAIRANDMFLVRYDGDRQASLARHTDDGSITFQALLSYGFEGGGTRYWNRAALDDNDNPGAPFTYVLPKAGMMTTFPAMIEHEGVQTTQGRRYLLIGFLAVDKIDPWTHRPTGLSWFASWGSLNWASTKFKEGVKSTWKDEHETMSGFIYSDEARQLFQFAHKLFVGICDVMFPHRFAVLVDESSADDYLRDLDEAYELKQQHFTTPNDQRSSWFAGQQISLNIDGSFRRNWESREDAGDKFDGLK